MTVRALLTFRLSSSSCLYDNYSIYSTLLINRHPSLLPGYSFPLVCHPLYVERLKLTNSDQVIRGDGTIVELERAIGPKQEFKEFLYMFKDIRMLLLFPMFFSSNYCKSFSTQSAHVDFSLRIPRSHHRCPIQRSNSSSRLPPYRTRLHHRIHHHRSPHRQVAFQAKEPSRRFLFDCLPSHRHRLGSWSWIPSSIQQEQRRSWYNLQGRAFTLGLEDVFCCRRTYRSSHGL